MFINARDASKLKKNEEENVGFDAIWKKMERN